MNYQGNINLSKLQKVGIATIHGKRCVIIPLEENDIYVRENENADTKAERKYSCINIGVSMWESKPQENPQFDSNNSHYLAQSFSKEYREKNPDIRVSLGNMKPMELKSFNQAETTSAPNVDVEGNDDLPF